MGSMNLPPMHTNKKPNSKKISGGKVPEPSYKRSAFDAYPTPVVATEILLAHEKFSKRIWECASGTGDISKVLERHGHEVESSDLQTHDGIYGEKGVDFLLSNKRVDSIVSNPPYVLAEEFILKALECTGEKCAFLVRIAFLESIRRYQIFKEHPPSKVIVISRRLPFYANNKWNNKGAVFGHAWIIWSKQYNGPTILEWATF
jgi:hypothetical protein